MAAHLTEDACQAALREVASACVAESRVTQGARLPGELLAEAPYQAGVSEKVMLVMLENASLEAQQRSCYPLAAVPPSAAACVLAVVVQLWAVPLLRMAMRSEAVLPSEMVVAVGTLWRLSRP